MQYRRLGQSGPEISAVSFGAWQIGDAEYWGSNADSDARATIDQAIESGINFFDTAELYGDGESERALGKLLGGRRKDVYVASKVWPDNCKAVGDIRKACEASLDRLGMDYVDLYQMHWPVRHLPIGEVCAEMDQLIEDGLARYIGVSNFGPIDLADWTGSCVSNQIGYNLAFRAPEEAIVTACMDRGVGVLAYMPLLQGLLSGRWTSAEDVPALRRRTRHFSSDREGAVHGEPGCETLFFETLAKLQAIADDAGRTLASLSLSWLVAQSGVTSIIVGGHKPSQLERNLDGLDFDLPPDLRDALTAATAPLKTALGPNCDMWRAGEEARIR